MGIAPSLKSLASLEVLYTCILSYDQQGATRVFQEDGMLYRSVEENEPTAVLISDLS